MAFNYAGLKATADRLIAAAGQAATLSRPVTTGGSVNPVAGTPLTYPVQVVVDAYRQHEIDGTRIRRDDLKVMLAKGALTIDPKTTDRLLIGGVSYAIIDIRPTNPGGAVVMWEIQARR